MLIKSFLTKTNTIVSNSTINTGNNPVCELYYGGGFTRVLLKFDASKISNLATDKTYSDITKLKHVLKLKNCWGLQTGGNRLVINSGSNGYKERTSSFDLYLLRMPETWDGGSGNDYTTDGFITQNAVVSHNGSNWYNSATETLWTEGSGGISGITVNNTVTTQHFDFGNEDIEMDITNEINSILTGQTTNNGYMLCFSKLLEDTSTDITQYVGFFANTNTLYKPFIETTNSEVISDDRNNFYLDKDNKLYFYSRVGGQLENLDNIPICTIENLQRDVFQQGKGVYYININLDSSLYSSNQMVYDTWGNITYKGKTYPEVELDFVTVENLDYFNFGNGKVGCEIKKYVPNIYGIKNGEKIIRTRNEVRKINVTARVQYTTNETANIDNMEYFIYAKEGNKVIDVMNGLINKSNVDNYFMLDMESLLPNDYFVDIKIKANDEIINHREILKFTVVNEL